MKVAAWRLLAACIPIPALMTGCASAGAGSELAARPPQPLVLPEKESQVVHLPQDGKFSIHLAPSSRTPALEGKAEAQSDASPDGHAKAIAMVENGGTASATFQLGHAFQNTTDHQVDLKINLRFSYEYVLDLTPRGTTPDVTVNLGLFARGGRNQLLKSQSLMSVTTDVGAVNGKDAKDQQLTITLSPHDTISIFVAGTVAIDSKPDRKAAGSIELKGLQMDLTVSPAPEVKSSTSQPASKPSSSKPSP